MKKIICFVSAIILCIALSVPSFAAGGSICSVNYTNASQFLFNPEGGDLFSNFKGVMPGDELSQEIIISNQLATRAVTLYLRAEVDKKYEKFLNNIDIEVFLKKGNAAPVVLAKNKASEPGKLAENVNIGTYAPGEKGLLTVNIKVDKAMGNEFKKAIGVIDWIFSAEEGDEITTQKPTITKPSEKPKTTKAPKPTSEKPSPSPSPNTGSDERVGAILGITAGVTGLVVLYVIKKKKPDSSNEVDGEENDIGY